MIVEASVTGLFRTLLIVIGVIVILRFIGRLLIAKRNIEIERKLHEQKRNYEKERSKTLKKFGKTSILSSRNKTKKEYNDAEDVDYTEI